MYIGREHSATRLLVAITTFPRLFAELSGNRPGRIWSGLYRGLRISPFAGSVQYRACTEHAMPAPMPYILDRTRPRWRKRGPSRFGTIKEKGKNNNNKAQDGVGAIPKASFDIHVGMPRIDESQAVLGHPQLPPTCILRPLTCIFCSYKQCRYLCASRFAKHAAPPAGNARARIHLRNPWARTV